MTDQTKSEALEASILHWQENVKAETPDDVQVGADECALCELYYYDADCEGCPVADKGDPGCVGSPYMVARDALYIWASCLTDPDDKTAWLAARDEFRKAAQAEVDFLISLRETD